MEKFLPYFTGDGSVGLFSEDFDDIYHSASGALTEAYEKFVEPINLSKNNIKVLDICFGLGYNSKSFLTKYFNKQITFDVLDINKNLIFLSPIIKTNSGNKNTKKILSHFSDEQINIIKKYSNQKSGKKYSIKEEVNQVVAKSIYENFGDEFINFIFSNRLKEFSSFFDPKQLNFIKKYHKFRMFDTPKGVLSTFLHNIYYMKISKRYKKMEKLPIKFNFYIIDARSSIQKLKNDDYDVVFLDAFTTSKCPQLWSLDFIKEIYNKASHDGVVVTYSSANIVRNTFLEAGFNVGKIIKNNKSIGTICSKNKKMIKHPLDDFEYGLLKSKSGIPYRDEGLNNSADKIIDNRNNKIKNSDLISSSKYIKQKEHNNEI